jgi:glycosyltransferase involved in cell wall biosynthesis
MAAYNNAAYIKAAIESAVAQTYPDWELVICDDGSTDGTLELATVLAATDARIKMHSNGKNIGCNATMHKLSTLATGEFIAHFDSDDMLERYAVEEMLLEFSKRPDAQFIYSDMMQIGKRNEFESYMASPTFDRTKLYQHGWRHFGMYRAQLLNEIQGYNVNLFDTNGCHDGDLFMQIAEKYPVYRLPKPLYLYRRHDNNISVKNAKCVTCDKKPVCNYARVWCEAAKFDLLTFKPLEQIHE